MVKYTIILTPEPEGGYMVTAPSLPGLVTYGRTIEEAKAMAREAIELYLEDVRECGESIPQDTGAPEARKRRPRSITGEIEVDFHAAA